MPGAGEIAPRNPPSALLTRVSVAAACGVVALFSITFLVGSTPDEEEFRFAVLSAWLRAGTLLHGRLEFWTATLGLGVPQPFTPAFLFHPIFPLLAVVSPVHWARLLLVVHTILGAAGMWQLTRHLRITVLTGALCVSTFLLATPAQNYALVDFWPTHFIVWTSAPWILLLAYRLLEADRRSVPIRSVALGLCTGLVLANTNLGYAIVYGTVVAAMVLVHWHCVMARGWWLALAGLIAAALVAPGLVQLAHEQRHFAANLPIENAPAPLPQSAVWNVFFSPFGFVYERWPFARTLFLGGPFAVLCIVGCVRMARRHAELVLVVVSCTVLLFTSLVPLSLASARFHFRDPLTLAAILLAGLAFDQLITASGRRRLTTAVLTTQLALLLVSAWPALGRAWTADARRGQWFRGGAAESQSVETLLTFVQPGGRMVFSPAVDIEISSRLRLAEGLGVNALAYRGVPVVNGWFKGVSTDAIWPDERMFYGRVRAPQQLIESAAALDVLAIRYVLANDDEPVAEGLRRRGVVPKKIGAPFVLYENADAWPDAFVLDAEAEQSALPMLPGCANDRVLCTDLGGVAERRIAENPVVRQREGQIDVRLFVADQPRLLVVSQMFRPDWIAAAGDRRLTTVPALGGLLGIRIPPGTASVQLHYRPTMVMLTTLLAWSTLVGGLVAVIVLRRLVRPAPRS